MKISVLQENLTKGLSVTSRFVNSRAQLPILSNVLFSAEKAKLVIQATNLETSISLSVGAKVEEEGKITLPAKTINDLVSNLPPGILNMELEKDQLKIFSQESSILVSGMSSNDFPIIPSEIEEQSSVFEGKSFLSSVSKVLFSASSDETRPILTGVLFLFDENYLSLVSTDGFRLSQKKVKIKEPFKKEKLVLPKNILSEIIRISEGEDVGCSLRDIDNQIVFVLRNSILTSRLLEGEFPNFEKIIPKTTTTKVFIDKGDLLRAIKVASVFAREVANVVNLKLNKEGLSVFVQSSRSGSQKTHVDAKVEGEDLEIAYNFRFLEEFLNIIEGDDLEIDFSSNLAPGVFRDPKDPDFLHLIMPVRIQG